MEAAAATCPNRWCQNRSPRFADPTGAPAGVTPGSLTVCARCATIAVVIGDGALRLPTARELREAEARADVAVMRLAVIRSIRAVARSN